MKQQELDEVDRHEEDGQDPPRIAEGEGGAEREERAEEGQVKPYLEEPRNPMDHGGIAE
jgi:hypothetical protein